MARWERLEWYAAGDRILEPDDLIAAIHRWHRRRDGRWPAQLRPELPEAAITAVNRARARAQVERAPAQPLDRSA